MIQWHKSNEADQVLKFVRDNLVDELR